MGIDMHVDLCVGVSICMRPAMNIDRDEDANRSKKKVCFEAHMFK